jgi:hypothetical protein
LFLTSSIVFDPSGAQAHLNSQSGKSLLGSRLVKEDKTQQASDLESRDCRKHLGSHRQGCKERREVAAVVREGS